MYAENHNIASLAASRGKDQDFTCATIQHRWPKIPQVFGQLR